MTFCFIGLKEEEEIQFVSIDVGLLIIILSS